MSRPEANTLSATEAAEAIRDRRLTSTALVQACLDRIAETDGTIRAWAHLDPEYALAQAAELDAIRQAGMPMGPLHGVPVGLKDIVDTNDFPAERGTPIFAGRRPDTDAAIVARLREAGAVILGKTVTTELAFLHPSVTRNPHDTEHSPGGSSSGSAAAVGALQVPLAIGTQTNGSVIRPASFCGAVGFKPTRGVIPRGGVLQTSKTLDQVGVFARSLEDAALLADVIAFHDPADPLSYPRARPRMLDGCHAEPPVPPDLVWLDMPYHDRLQPEARAGFEEIMELLGARVERMPASEHLAGLVEVQRTIHEFEICQHLAETFSTHWDQVSPTLKPIIEHGRGISQAEYEDALAVMDSAIDFFRRFFHDYDAVIAPSSAGEAPLAADGTGDPVFCTIWTLVGLPAVSLPLLVGAKGLPVGVQLIGAAERDDRLLRTARWLVETVQAAA